MAAGDDAADFSESPQILCQERRTPVCYYLRSQDWAYMGLESCLIERYGPIETVGVCQGQCRASLGRGRPDQIVDPVRAREERIVAVAV